MSTILRLPLKIAKYTIFTGLGISTLTVAYMFATKPTEASFKKYFELEKKRITNNGLVHQIAMPVLMLGIDITFKDYGFCLIAEVKIPNDDKIKRYYGIVQNWYPAPSGNR